MQRAGLKPTGQRIYLNEKEFPGPVPNKWPPISGNPAHACVSIRPNLDLLLNHKLDRELTTFLRNAPAGPTSLLGLWHEASTGGPDGIYRKVSPHVTGKKLTAAQKYVQALAQRVKANVKVGAIDIVGITRPAEWMATNLDFYACDIYDNKNCNAMPYPMLGQFKEQCDRLVSSKNATISVTECNSRRSERRPFWFHTVWSWLQVHGYTSNTSCFLTFWRLNAPESGGWRPNDKATIEALKAIFEQSSP
jgi:hypothetical protein